MKMITKNGYSTFEVISALQKEIRRGNEKNAMYWALELAYTDKGTFTALMNRLKITNYENIGLADSELVLQVSQAIDDAIYIKNNSTTNEWDIILGHIILNLCRSVKSRVADHFKVYVKKDYWANNKLQIPDYALDYHTSRGIRKGRKKTTMDGYKHFTEEGELLVNENKDLDIYKSKAHIVWRKRAEKQDDK